MHHLQYSHKDSRPVDKAKMLGRWEDLRVFKCSSCTCPTVVTIRIKAPIITLDDVKHLTDDAQLKARRDALDIEPEDRKYKNLDAYEALSSLEAVVRNAIKDDRRSPSKGNERFAMAIGELGASIMQKAHFRVRQEAFFSAWKSFID